MNKTHESLQIGDLVAPMHERQPLRCGSGVYENVVVVQKQPLVLVSRSGNMRWEHTIQDRDFRVVGVADAETLGIAQKRL